MIDRNHAVVINLSGEVLEDAKRVWRLFDEEFGIRDRRQNSKCPHLTFVAGGATMSDRNFVERTKIFAASMQPVELKANGVGILLSEHPTYYIRWKLTQGLADLHAAMFAEFEPFIDPLHPSVRPDLWIPKSTLATGDTDMKTLGKASQRLLSLGFEQPMVVNNVTALFYDRIRETELAVFGI
jgi:hypothetical protein